MILTRFYSVRTHTDVCSVCLSLVVALCSPSFFGVKMDGCMNVKDVDKNKQKLDGVVRYCGLEPPPLNNQKFVYRRPKRFTTETIYWLQEICLYEPSLYVVLFVQYFSYTLLNYVF